MPLHSKPVLSMAARYLAAAGLAAAMSGCGTLQDWRDENKGIQLDLLQAPAGQRVTVFARDLPKARHLALAADGTLYVGSMDGAVYRMKTGGETAREQQVIANGLTDPSGVAWRDGALFVANRSSIVRFDNIDAVPAGALATAPKTVLSGLPDKARHDAHAMAFGPDGMLYVSIGAPCDTCEAKNDEHGVIVRVRPDGSGREVVARGIRNSVGFDWHPTTRELWFTDNGSDDLGLNRPNDELNRVRRTGENFGFPYCHDGSIPDPEFGKLRPCSDFTPPAFGLGPHVAALGMRFDSSSATPRIIVARHGSHPPTRVGYDVVQIALAADGKATMTPYLTGFLQGNRYWGRPVDMVMLRDGSMLVSDDLNGAIYRIAR